MMLVGLGLLSGMFLVELVPTYGMVLAVIILASLGKNIFDPALQAYVGQRVSYANRGLAMGAIEVAWAGSTLVGIPLVGVLTKVLQRFVPEKHEGEQPHLTFLDVRMLDTPAFGIEQSFEEIKRMGEGVRKTASRRDCR